MMLTREQIAAASTEELGKRLNRKILNTLGSNQKLGALAVSFSLPQGKAWSCPDATQLCERVCYVTGFTQRRPAIFASYTENFWISQRKDFAEILTYALALVPPVFLRIHVAGDFYSVPYINAWGKALARNTHLRPFGFTRAWRNRYRRAALERNGMGGNKGVEGKDFIMASVDAETGLPPENWRVALMDTETTIWDVKGKRKAVPALLCNNQNPHAAVKQTCADCGRCPLVKMKTVDNQPTFVPLGAAARQTGVVFAEH